MSTYPSPDGDLMVMMFADGSHLQIGAKDKPPLPPVEVLMKATVDDMPLRSLGGDEGPPRVGYNGCCLADCDCDPDYELPAETLEWLTCEACGRVWPEHKVGCELRSSIPRR